jgi:hypothetical protein
MVLAVCADRTELESMMAKDSFISTGVASYQAYACSPALAAAQFPTRWAAEAKFI